MSPRRLRTLLTAVLAAAVGTPSLAAPAGAAEPARCDALEPVADEVVVGYDGPSVPATVRTAVPPGTAIEDRPPHYAIVALPPTDANEALLRAAPGVRFAEPNHRSCISATPNDPLVRDMWPVAATHGARLAGAWDLATAGNVTVAVIDTGIDPGHPDLAGALWTNPREVAGNGADDDGNGFVDDVRGVNLITRRGDGVDDQGHGTFVAGLIGARANNGIGIAGVAWDSRLMAIKAMDAHGQGTSTAIADGIRYAVAGGARIINLSINGDAPDRVQEEAIAAAQSAGAIVVASAGNEGRDIDLRPSYPASFPQRAIVAVAATASSGEFSPFSNRGPRAVDIAAPGEEVMSTQRGGGYGAGSGTSFAAPHVAGVLALLAAARPDLDSDKLLGLLVAGSRPAGGLPVGGGRLDAAGALAMALPERAAALGRSTRGSGVAGGAPAGRSPGVGSGRGGSASTAGAAARLTATLARSSLRVRAGRRSLRWTLRGADLPRVARMTVAVDGRTVLRRALRTRRSTLTLRTALRLERGTRRVRLTLLDGSRRTLVAQTARVRVRR